MTLLSGIINTNKFNMTRCKIYEFSYTNLGSPQEKPMVINPLIVFSAIDQNRRIHGLDIRLLRNKESFIDDLQKFYYNGDTISSMEVNHPHAFSFRILRAIFKRNPDIESAWRVYNPLYMKNVNNINITEARYKIKEFNKVYINNMGVL